MLYKGREETDRLDIQETEFFIIKNKRQDGDLIDSLKVHEEHFVGDSKWMFSGKYRIKTNKFKPWTGESPNYIRPEELSHKGLLLPWK